jgi:hypothetical protein
MRAEPKFINSNQDKEQKPKERPRLRLESQMTLPKAILLSLGLATRPRRRIESVKKDESEQKPKDLKENCDACEDKEKKSSDKIEGNQFRDDEDKENQEPNSTPSLNVSAEPFIPKPVPKVSSSVLSFPAPGTSKLQNRLNRFKETSTVQQQQKEEKPQICKPDTSTQQPPKIQIEVDIDALSKLSNDQQNHIQYIAKVPSKYFQEVYDYFVLYYFEIGVHLDLDAVDLYLRSCGLTFVRTSDHQSHEIDQHKSMQQVLSPDEANALSSLLEGAKETYENFPIDHQN